ncbi:MAG: HlyC/CorC family transporter [Alphaproteobacteria bacterium]|nr:HlyC/CorC family transporter [Alphaproteobacteria bacterium]
MTLIAVLPYGVLILFFIALSALFSACETALIAASKSRLHTLQKRGVKGANLVILLRNQPEKLIGTILLCNSLTNIISASLATKIFIEFFGDDGVVYASALMTVLIVIYAEVMPKIYAISYAESVSLLLSPWLYKIVRLTSFLTYFFEKVARFSLNLFGIKIDPNAKLSSTEEELRGAIDLHQTDEDISQEKAMLHSILDLNDVFVDEIMIHRSTVSMINAQLPLNEILDQMVSSPFTRIPIWENHIDNIIGVINAKGLLRAIQSHADALENFDIRNVCIKPYFVPETTTLQEQLQAFRERREHFALVVDEYGAFQGIVTLEDILEEIVGEITDEHDIKTPGIWTHKNGEIFAIGSTTIRDLNRNFNWTLPDEEASTIAGLLIYEARIIPKSGQTFNLGGYRLSVIRRVRNKVTLIKIIPPNPASPHLKEFMS